MKKIVFIFIFLAISSSAWASVYQVHIATNENESHRKKEGDIVSIHKENHTPGKKTVKQYLIVKVDFGDITLEEARRLMIPYYEDGSTFYQEEKKVNRIAQNRFKISFNDITTKAVEAGKLVNWNSVKAGNVETQPVKDVILPKAYIYDKYSSKKLSTIELEDFVK